MGNCSALFYSSNSSNTQTLDYRIRPTDQQIEYLQKKWRDLAEHLTEYLAGVSGHRCSTWIQGSYKFGTLVRPPTANEEFDVDLGAYLLWSSDIDDTAEVPTPKTLKDWVQDACEEYHDPDALEVVTPAKERCSRIRFNRQFHIDIPSYKLVTDLDERWLATEGDTWEDSDPKAIVKWFREEVETPQRHQLRRMIRYLKMWAALAFVGEFEKAKPSSVLLTVLTVEAFDHKPADASEEDDVLAWLIGYIAERLEGNDDVPNPVNPGEDLNRLDVPNRDRMREAFSRFAEIASDAQNTEDAFLAASKWAIAFQHFFPLPEVAQNKAALPVRYQGYTPEVRITATDRRTKAIVGQWANEVPRVPKDCDLFFEVINAGDAPVGASWSWVVRNDGEEAETRNDLGHLRENGLTEVHEHTAYMGRHFMDITVFNWMGQIIGGRRISVSVLGTRYAPRNPLKKPDYVRHR